MKPPTVEEMKGRESSLKAYEQKKEAWYVSKKHEWLKKHPYREQCREFIGNLFCLWILVLIVGGLFVVMEPEMPEVILAGKAMAFITFVVFPVSYLVVNYYSPLRYPYRDKWYEAQICREIDRMMNAFDRAGI